MHHASRIATTLILGATLGLLPRAAMSNEQPAPYANQYDIERAARFSAREADWRIGPIVYQVIVDRFAPPANIEEKRALYPSPKRLRNWEEAPTKGTYNEEARVWSHEIDFWGGDLQSLASRIDYIRDFGADVLYLCPIHLGFTNHKYDSLDFFEVSPEYGTRADVKSLTDTVHKEGMRIVLDGVFNHMGRQSAWFKSAIADEKSPYRDWFMIGKEYKMGYRGWYNVENLPELNLENPAVRAKLWGDPDSVVQGYLREGVDGWRLDVAYDFGFNYLDELTRATREARPDSLTIGEIWNYPAEWFPALDGVMNFHLRSILFDMARGNISGPHGGRLISRMIEDAGIDNMLRSWVLLDNHDVKRIATEHPDTDARHAIQVLQFTLPGAPNVYYGVELGMTGGEDPEQRGPMRWDLVTDENEELHFMKQLVSIRRGNRALRIGDFQLLDTEKTFAFNRTTDRVAESTIVIYNGSNEAVTERFSVRDSKLMDNAMLRDAFTGREFRVGAGMVTIDVPAKTAMVLTPNISKTVEYSNFKRVQ